MPEPSPNLTCPLAAGLIGVGLVGTALAERLLAAGHSLTGYDVAADRRQALAALGGTPVESARAVAQAGDPVLLSLPDTDAVLAAVTGEDGVLSARPLPSTLIDTTTGDPWAVEGLAAHLAGRGIAYLDATISGSSQQVRDGQAVYMVGGPDGAYAACAPLFDALGGRCFHLGPAGCGTRAKLASNLIMGLNRLALAEGLVFAEALGLDPARFLELLVETPAYSRQMDTKGPKMTAGDFAPQARLTQHAKDVSLILDSAARLGLYLPASRLHQALLRAAIEAGDGTLDNSAIIRQLQRLQREQGGG
ncbi:MAG: NAD(P)-dependent oxidoreductase [Gemmatimonadota bacterium]